MTGFSYHNKEGLIMLPHKSLPILKVRDPIVMYHKRRHL